MTNDKKHRACVVLYFAPGEYTRGFLTKTLCSPIAIARTPILRFRDILVVVMNPPVYSPGAK